MISDFPLVSVLMPLYNKELFVAEAIESVLNQTYSNIEIIIVDDGSTDNSFAIAKSYESKNVFLYRQENKGASAARNTAFNHAKGDFIQYLDTDDLLHRDKIIEQIKNIGEENDVLATAQWGYFKDSVNENFIFSENSSLKRDFVDSSEFLLHITQQGLPIHAWLIPRLLIEKAGKWHEKMSVFDDYAFFFQLIPFAKSIKYCKSSICYYRQPTSYNNLSLNRTHKDLLASFYYINQVENRWLSSNCIEERQTIACVYKKLLCISANDKIIVDDLKNRAICLGLAPHCGKRNSLVFFFEKIMGMSFVFWLIRFKLKYFSNLKF